MKKVLSYILCDLDPKVKVIGQKAGICDGVPLTSALVIFSKMVNNPEKRIPQKQRDAYTIRKQQIRFY